ncbi:SigE family RNA polymerase sigma factor [Streptomyces sp. BRA346]|uniref:SigE family RNA polymerase sigma factor n=1 Tax=Streptomyces sp. BRA346 TaxID=2878199 RepID=UPI0040637F8E
MAGGDWTEFEEFVAACGPRLLRSAWFLTGDRHLAEDLLQSALARVWPKWGRIAEENPEAYVRRTLVHLHASWWRRHWRREVPHSEVPEPSSRGGPAGASPQVGEVDQGRTIIGLLRLLPRRQREVVVLRYLEDLSVEQTAAVLGCSTGTVKSQASKALNTLRTRLPGLDAGLVPAPEPVRGRAAPK